MSLPGWVLTEKIDPLSGTRIRSLTHCSGFRLILLPRPGFARRFGSICIPFGSVHGTWRDARGKVEIPPGTAHYLEHCVFSKEEGGGLLSRLSSIGADANAYTSHTHTMYHFTSVERFNEALFTYFDAVMAPPLTDRRVEEERGIILSEIGMYHDDPDSRAFTTLLEGMYGNHPVRVDIAGTPDSVGRITATDLKTVADAFYRPSAATVTLVGDLDEASILEGFDARMDATSVPLPLPEPVEEGPSIPLRETTLHMDVGASSFLIGIKDPHVLPDSPLDGLALVERKLAGRLLTESLLGPSSSLFNDLFARGILNDSFGFQYICERDFAYLVAGGESENPGETAALVIEAFRQALGIGVDAELFEMQKRVAAGDFLRSMDQVRSCGMAAARAALDRIDLFEYPAVYDRIDARQAMDSMRFMADPERVAHVYVVQHSEEGTP